MPEYWVVNLRDKLVEVHSNIVGGEYWRIVPYSAGETIAPAAFPDVQIDPAQILR